jgi:hypothetical protein
MFVCVQRDLLDENETWKLSHRCVCLLTAERDVSLLCPIDICFWLTNPVWMRCAYRREECTIQIFQLWILKKWSLVIYKLTNVYRELHLGLMFVAGSTFVLSAAMKTFSSFPRSATVRFLIFFSSPFFRAIPSCIHSSSFLWFCILSLFCCSFIFISLALQFLSSFIYLFLLLYLSRLMLNVQGKVKLSLSLIN